MVQKVLNSFLFGLGRTLQELLDKNSCRSFIRSVGYNMLEYLDEKLVLSDPRKTITKIAKWYVREGAARDFKIRCRKDMISFTISLPVGSAGFEELTKIYGLGIHARPSPLFALLFAALGKIGYNLEFRRIKYDPEKNEWYMTAKLEKIRFIN